MTCSSGAITIDGVDMRDYQLENLRQQFALVSQHSVLFNDTIAHNIAYGRQIGDVSREQIEAAARAAYAWEFIQEFPKGLDEVIGENGVLLSGGQRQRIAIARALLKNAPILILDEATSSLDTHSERQIQAALENLMQRSTTFVIAHRLSTIENADWILVMDKGRIIEQGAHEVLLSQKGAYEALHRLQFKETVARDSGGVDNERRKCLVSKAIVFLSVMAVFMDLSRSDGCAPLVIRLWYAQNRAFSGAGDRGGKYYRGRNR